MSQLPRVRYIEHVIATLFQLISDIGRVLIKSYVHLLSADIHVSSQLPIGAITFHSLPRFYATCNLYYLAGLSLYLPQNTLGVAKPIPSTISKCNL